MVWLFFSKGFPFSVFSVAASICILHVHARFLTGFGKYECNAL